MAIYNVDFTQPKGTPEIPNPENPQKEVKELVEDQSVSISLTTRTIKNWNGVPSPDVNPPENKIKHYTAEAQRVFCVNYSEDPLDAIFTMGIPATSELYPTVAEEADPDGGPEATINWALKYNLIVVDHECENIENLDYTHKITVKYKTMPQDGDEWWELRNTGDTVETNYCITQDEFGTNANFYGNIVGVNEDGTISGVSIPDKIQELTVHFWKDTGDVTQAYLDGLRDDEFKTNNAIYYGQPVGSVFFKSWDIVNQDSLTTEFEFKFLINPPTPQADLDGKFEEFDGSTIDFTRDKKGWEYLWIQTATKNPTGKDLQYTRGTYLSKIYEESDFTALGLSGKLGDNAP